MSKISIVIPVYNVEKYLSQCLDSVINQTEREIEIIVVEDKSTDKSLSIAEEYADKDDRIKIIKHIQNMGLSKTRKDGTLIASGEYVMHLDSDDYIEPDTCEKLYKLIKEKSVDIVQFGTYLEYGDNVSHEMAQWVADFMEPTEEYICSDKLEESCFIDGKINCNLVNKIWKKDLAQKIYQNIDDERYVSGEDRYATFIGLYFAESEIGTKEKFYHYRLGVGVTGGETLEIEKFESRCKGADVIHKVYDFLVNNQSYEKYKTVYEAFSNDILWDCVDCWYNKLSGEDKQKGYGVLLNNWQASEVVSAIARVYFEKRHEVSNIIDAGERIAIYYRYVGYDMMNSVIENYINSVKDSAEFICLISDSDAPEKNENAFGKKLYKIPSTNDSNWYDYRNRAEQLENILKENRITQVIYLSPTSHIEWLDKIVIEGNGIRCNLVLDEYQIDCLNKMRSENEQIKKELLESYDEKNQIEAKYNAIINTRWYKLVVTIKRILKR